MLVLRTAYWGGSLEELRVISHEAWFLHVVYCPLVLSQQEGYQKHPRAYVLLQGRQYALETVKCCSVELQRRSHIISDNFERRKQSIATWHFEELSVWVWLDEYRQKWLYGCFRGKRPVYGVGAFDGVASLGQGSTYLLSWTRWEEKARGKWFFS